MNLRIRAEIIASTVKQQILDWHSTEEAGEAHYKDLINSITSALTPPQGYIIDDTETVRKVLAWSVNPLTNRIHAEFESTHKAAEKAKGAGMRKHEKVTTVSLFLAALFFGFVLLWAFVIQPMNESATYNRLTGAKTTWWDALWVELRVQDEAAKEVER